MITARRDRVFAAILACAGVLASRPAAQTTAVAEGRRLIFYRDVDYGSESPATVVINVGLWFYGPLGQEPRADAGTHVTSLMHLREADPPDDRWILVAFGVCCVCAIYLRTLK